MYLDSSEPSLSSSEAWLVLIMYAGFWLYSYYSLTIYLIHTRQKNNLLEDLELENNSSADVSL